MGITELKVCILFKNRTKMIVFNKCVCYGSFFGRELRFLKDVGILDIPFKLKWHGFLFLHSFLCEWKSIYLIDPERSFLSLLGERLECPAKNTNRPWDWKPLACNAGHCVTFPLQVSSRVSVDEDVHFRQTLQWQEG